MRIELLCRVCGHAWMIAHEPRALLALRCPACAHEVLARAAEDLSTALEDALCQLSLCGQAVGMRIVLDSDTLPEAFT